MDFSLSDDQRALKASVIKFATQELNNDLRKRERIGEFPLNAWRTCADSEFRDCQYLKNSAVSEQIS